MSAWGRALAGAGGAAADIANKYIDAEIANSRAQVLADIQRRSQLQLTKETDAYTRDPARLAAIRSETALDAASTNESTMAAAMARASHKPLTEAEIARTNAIESGTAPTRAESAGAIARAQARATPHRTNPGDIVFDGEGREIARNTNPTAGELQLTALREGLKGKSKEERDRAYERVLQDTGGRLKELDKIINEGIAQGTLTPKKPESKSTWLGLGEDEPGKDPAYDRWQQLQRERAVLNANYNAVAQEMRGGTVGAKSGAAPAAGKADPFGLRGESAAPAALDSRPEYAKESGLSAQAKVTPADEEAAKTGGAVGDYQRDPAYVAALEKRLADPKTPGGERDAIRLEMERLKAAAATAPAPAAAPAPVPAAPASSVMGRAQQRTAAEVLAEGGPRLNKRQAGDAAVKKAAEEAVKSETATRTAFDEDLAKLSALDFVRKYQSLRSMLEEKQLVKLAQLQRSV
jgi:hypothetical protein